MSYNRRKSDARRQATVARSCTAQLEWQLSQAGYRWIAGVDEVGRGALAGPVVAGAVILDLDCIPDGIDDSKKLTANQRQRLAEAIKQSAVTLSVAAVEAEQVDQLGIVPATRLAMQRAIAGLARQPDYLLIDALRLEGLPMPQQAIVHGDASCLSIAAASIVAKVARDAMMKEQDRIYPGYGFARHVGYGTREHRQALNRLGPCAIHRRSFHGVTPDLFSSINCAVGK